MLVTIGNSTLHSSTFLDRNCCCDEIRVQTFDNRRRLGCVSPDSLWLRRANTRNLASDINLMFAKPSKVLCHSLKSLKSILSSSFNSPALYGLLPQCGQVRRPKVAHGADRLAAAGVLGRVLLWVLGGVEGCQMAKFDPFLSLDCVRVEGVGAQSKERKG